MSQRTAKMNSGSPIIIMALLLYLKHNNRNYILRGMVAMSKASFSLFTVASVKNNNLKISSNYFYKFLLLVLFNQLSIIAEIQLTWWSLQMSLYLYHRPESPPEVSNMSQCITPPRVAM